MIIFRNVSENPNSIQLPAEPKGEQHATCRNSDVSQNVRGKGVEFSKGTNPYTIDGIPKKGKGCSVSDIQKMAESMDVGLSQDFMTIMSHTMSETDFKKLTEDGFDPGRLRPEEMVTILDKIKTELIKSGQNIVGYTDDIDLDTLKNAVGSETLANALKDSLSGADVCITEDLAKEISGAWQMAKSLTTPTDEACSYMLENGFSGEIKEFYLAQNSVVQGSATTAYMYYSENVNGYLSAKGDYRSALESENITEVQRFQHQIDQVIQEAGQHPDEEWRDRAGWLLERNMPLTAENLVRLSELTSVDFPVRETEFARAVADALCSGKSAYEANLVKGENLYEKALTILERYETVESIRLHMTAEVKVKLLKSGYALDTAAMEQVREAVKWAEQEIAKNYFPEDTRAVTNYQLYQETNTLCEKLAFSPAAILAGDGIIYNTLPEIYRVGEDWKQQNLKGAMDSYETMLTQPRADFGDSIKRAFDNIDDILADHFYEATEENRRAVRILGYNRMEITPQQIDNVREADRLVTGILEKMTPATVLDMIRKGINPLARSFEELNEYFQNRPEDFSETALSYGRFLYGLEQRKDITEEEKTSFIGIYRMMKQLEKNDGAATGFLLNTGAPLSFSNLLTAMRSSKAKGFDQKVDDSFGFLKTEYGMKQSISEQIEAAFSQVSQETDKEELAKQELLLLRSECDFTKEESEILKKAGIPGEIDNLIAAHSLLKKEEIPFGKGRYQRLWKENFKSATKYLEEPAEFRSVVEEAFEHTKEQLEEALSEADNYVDVRDLRATHRQLSVAMALSHKEEYVLPMEWNGQQGKLHLTIQSKKGMQGRVELSVYTEDNRQLQAQFEIKQGKVNGIVSVSGKSEVMNLSLAVDIFTERVKQTPTLPNEVFVVAVDGKTTNAYQGNNEQEPFREEQEDYDNATLYRLAKVFLQAVQDSGEVIG